MSDRRVAKAPSTNAPGSVPARRWSGLPAGLPAVSGSASRFLTRSDLIGSEFRPINTWFLWIFVWA